MKLRGSILRAKRRFWSNLRGRFPRHYWSAVRAVIRQEWLPRIRQAEEDKRWNDVRKMYLEMASECAESDEALYEIECEKLFAKALRYRIPVSDIPTEVDKNVLWTWGDYGRPVLFSLSFYALDKIVAQVEREHRKEWREQAELWVKLAAALIAGLTGIIGAVIGLVSISKRP